MKDAEKRLAELYIELPEVHPSSGGGVPAVLQGNLLFVGGHLPYANGRLEYKGRLGVEMNLDKGRLAARAALLGILSVVKKELGSLNKVKQIVAMNGFVASGGDFQEHDKVLDLASKLLVDLFGIKGNHTRTAVGVTALPLGAAVQISLILAVE